MNMMSTIFEQDFFGLLPIIMFSCTYLSIKTVFAKISQTPVIFFYIFFNHLDTLSVGNYKGQDESLNHPYPYRCCLFQQNLTK